jgi:hypothetical protein
MNVTFTLNYDAFYNVNIYYNKQVKMQVCTATVKSSGASIRVSAN